MQTRHKKSQKGSTQAVIEHLFIFKPNKPFIILVV